MDRKEPMTKRELTVLFAFHMKQRMGEHVILEDIEDNIDTDDSLCYQIAKVPFNIDTIFGAGEIGETDLSLRLFIRNCVLKQDLASLYEKYIHIFSTNNLVELFLLEAGIACIEVRKSNEFMCVLYPSVVYTPTYGESIESLTKLFSELMIPVANG